MRVEEVERVEPYPRGISIPGQWGVRGEIYLLYPIYPRLTTPDPCHLGKLTLG